jgi:hypothetical protein
MLTRQQGAIAVALVESSTWTWELKVDHRGLFRWYLDGTIETNLRGCTVNQAESALRRFVDNSLRGELKISYPTERIGANSESGNSRFKSASVG